VNFTTLAASSTVSGTGFSTYLASPPAIGGSAAAAGSFTALSGTSITDTGLLTLAGEDSITAFATGGQTSATALSATKNYHRVATVATAADSVKLPASSVGLAHYVRNDGAAAMQVFGAGTDTINGVATATGISQAPGMGVWYICTTAGNWTTSPVSIISATTAFRMPDGTASIPGVSFSSETNTGLYRSSVGNIGFVVGSTNAVAAFGGTELRLGSGATFGFSSNASAVGATADTILVRDAASTFAQKNSTTAQVWRQYFSTTGPVYWQTTARTAGALYTAVGGAAQVSYAQTTAPTCTTNCGTSPSVAGNDTAMIVTMGSSGVPASGWVITFNGTWPAAPSCIVQSALGTMVVGKMPIAVATTTTTITVTTNGTAPSTSDKYAVHCFGVS
jgi:hypothetical protein